MATFGVVIRNLGAIVFLALFGVGCGTHKRTVGTQGRETVETQPRKTVNAPETYRIPKESELYPLPPNPGRFLHYPIANTREYIDTFAEMAQYEMRAYGIPASITLAQGILESGSGKGELTQKTNNHFGIKCHTGWDGEFDFHDDDAKGECFRKYNHPMYSFRDHSIFLSSRSRYRFLFNLPRDDYRKWAYGLRKAGYATDRRYPEKLIALIEDFGLDRFDNEVVHGGLDTLRKAKNYEVFTYVIQKGDTLYGLSRKYAISVNDLMRINNLSSTNLSVGQVINVRQARNSVN